MKKQIARAALAVALLCSTAGAAIVATSTAAMAEDHVSRPVGEALNAAIKAAQKQDWATANTQIAAAEKAASSDFDKYKTNSIKAYLAIKQNDLASATAAYEAMIASPAFANVDPKEQQQDLHNGLLLSAQAKHWKLAASYGQRLEKLNAMDQKTYTVLAQAYYFSNDFTNAKQAAQKAIDLAKAAGKKPDEAALEIVMSAEAKNNDQAGAKKTLEELAATYGDPGNWGQLIDIALGTKGIKDMDALYLYRLRFFANAKGTLTDYADAAALALHLGYPAEAESDLEAGFAKGASRRGRAAALMSQARSGARADRRSLRQIAAAAKRSKYGEQDVKLAEDYWGYGRYADSQAAAERGIAKGHIKDHGEGQFILGISLVAQGKYSQARTALAKVDGSTARAQAAHLWDLWAKYKMSQTSTPASAAPASQQSAAPQQ